MKSRIYLLLSIILLASIISGCTKTETVVQEPVVQEVEEEVSAPETEEVAVETEEPEPTEVVKETVTLGISFPLTGDVANYGIAFSEAAQLHVDQINEAGGCGDYLLAVNKKDDKLSGEEAATIAEIYVNDPNIVGVVAGYYSGVIMAATPTYQDYGLPLISPCSSHPDFTSQGDYIFRNNSLNITETRSTVDIVQNYLKGKKVGILATNNDWGLSTGKVIREVIEEEGVMEVVAYEEVMPGVDDFSIPIANFIDAGADTIIAAAVHDILVPFLKQYKALDPEIMVGAFANLYNYDVIEVGGDTMNGVVFGVAYTNESSDPDVIAFRDAFLARTGNLPDSLSAQTYDSVGMFCEAISKVGADRSAIKDYLTTIEYDGVMGMTKFDENRTAVKSMIKMQIQNGDFVILDY